MKIISYQASGGSSEELVFSKMQFKQINLIVGESGSGKTRLLNTIFNGGRTGIGTGSFRGYWDMTIEINDQIYKWTIETDGDDNIDFKVISEDIFLTNNNQQEQHILHRTIDTFEYLNNPLPKLSTNESGISLLREEELIKPLYKALASIMRRSFSGSDLERATSYESMSQKLINKFKKHHDIDELFTSCENLNSKLYILKNFFKKKYDTIVREFINLFPFVEEVEVTNADKFGINFPGLVPVLAIKEKFINKWIPLGQLSSGMKKALLIITDILTMPTGGGIYLIDEYENSLGINAINFFPGILYEGENNVQFIITSHHPYIIGNVPVKNWIVLHRKGHSVLIKQGQELEEKLGKSKQQAFVKLINDQFYTEGV